MENSNNTINKLDLIKKPNNFTKQLLNTHYFQVHIRTFTKIDHMVSYKVSLKKFQQNEILLVCSDHSGIKLKSVTKIY